MTCLKIIYQIFKFNIMYNLHITDNIVPVTLFLAKWWICKLLWCHFRQADHSTKTNPSSCTRANQSYTRANWSSYNRANWSPYTRTNSGSIYKLDISISSTFIWLKFCIFINSRTITQHPPCSWISVFWNLIWLTVILMHLVIKCHLLLGTPLLYEHACEHKELSLSCGDGKSIKVKYANYGRQVSIWNRIVFDLDNTK